MKKGLVWFTSDLRIHDNETLMQALAECDEIIAVYCFDDIHYKTTKLGFKKTGSFRIRFLLESLKDLDKNLRTLGSGLIVVRGKPEVELLRLVAGHNIHKVFAKEEIAFEETQTQWRVNTELQKVNCAFETFNTSTLYNYHSLPFQIENLPDVFTDFRKKVEQTSVIRKLFETPKAIPSPSTEPLTLPSALELGAEEPTVDERAAIKFKGGETEAINRLDHYFFDTKAISTYKETRNGMIGENYSSKFSAWLSLGCISPVKIMSELKRFEAQYEANASTYWMFFELLWRDYFRYVMKKYGHLLFLKSGIKSKANAGHDFDQVKFDAWKNAQTGNDFIDANMLELKLTGFMSNRGRQNVASYLCNDLKIDWRYGAAYFEEQLIDYDVSSNWGNWAYLAGVGNDPRSNRVFNIEKQASDYDKDKKYRSLWLNK